MMALGDGGSSILQSRSGLSDAHIKSVELTVAIVPAGTSFPRGGSLRFWLLARPGGIKLIFLLVSWPQLGFGDRLFPGVLHIERVFVALAEGRLGKLLEDVRQEAADDGSERSIWQRRNARILPPLSTPSNRFYLSRRRLPRCDVVKLIPQITV
jgi:hypothetical protein